MTRLGNGRNDNMTKKSMQLSVVTGNYILLARSSFRYADFVRLSVLRSRGGGREEFTCNTVST